MRSRLLLGILQFVLNYNFVYAAELYITSRPRRGRVRAADRAQHARSPGCSSAAGEPAASSLGSAVAMRRGRLAVRPGDAAPARCRPAQVLTGLGLTCSSPCSPPRLQRHAVMPAMKAPPGRRHARLGDALRGARSTPCSPGPFVGPPVVEARPAIGSASSISAWSPRRSPSGSISRSSARSARPRRPIRAC